MEAGDDAGVKEPILWPVAEKGRFISPAILAEKQASPGAENGFQGSHRIGNFGRREGLGTDQQPVRRISSQCLRIRPHGELFGRDDVFTKET